MKRYNFLILSMLVSISGISFSQDTWIQKANFVGTRYGTIHFSIADKGYVGTGTDDISIKSDFWEFDPVANTWTQMADFGAGIRAFATSFSVGNKGYAGTGVVGSYDWRKDMWEYDPDINTWRRVADFAPGFPSNYGGGLRYGAVGFSIGSKGYMGTGNYRISPAYQSIYLNDFWEFDPSVGDSGIWTRKADVPEQGRTNAIGLGIGKKGYIGTGFYYYDTRKNDFWEYDVNDDLWTRKADIPGSERYAACAFTIGGKGYVGTGWMYSGLNDLWQFNPATNEWMQKASLPAPVRHIGTALSIGNKGYIGLGANNVGALNDFWEYSPDSINKSVVTFDPISVTTYAGNGEAGFQDGNKLEAKFNDPTGVASDGDGNVYIADYYNHRIRKITKDGVVSTFAGSGVAGFADGMGMDAKFNQPRAIAIDTFGTLYVSDEGNGCIRKITSAGMVSTLAGNGIPGFKDGVGEYAQFNRPIGITVDDNGNVFVADAFNNRIRKITSTGVVSTVAGNGIGIELDGYGTEAQFNYPNGLSFDGQGNLYIVQLYGRLRKMNTLGYVATVSTNPYPYDGGVFHQGVVIDPQGYVYMSIINPEPENSIYRISPNGTGSIVAGLLDGYLDGRGTEAKFGWLADLCFDKSGDLFVTDAGNDRIRKMSASLLNFSTVAGTTSAAQQFSVSGSYLYAKLTVSAPDGYEISENISSGYASTVTLYPSFGEINLSRIYIRLKGTGCGGSYNGFITLASAGADTQTLEVTGIVLDTIPPSVQCPPSQTFCYNASNSYTIPSLTATDDCSIVSITYEISGATKRSGVGIDASGLFNPGINVIIWTVADVGANTVVCSTLVRIDYPLAVSIPDVSAVLLGGRPNTIYKGFGLQCVVLTANPSGGTKFPGYNQYRYLWSNGSTSRYIVVCPTTFGANNYTVTVKDSLGCTISFTKRIHLVDVRCGPNNNEVLICWNGRAQSCYTQSQAFMALLLGAQLGSCNQEPSKATIVKGGSIDQNMPMERSIKVVPNPNSGSFTIHLKNITSSEIRIIDQSGRIVFRRHRNSLNTSEAISVNLTNLARGVYVLQSIGKDGVESYKMVVQ